MLLPLNHFNARHCYCRIASVSHHGNFHHHCMGIMIGIGLILTSRLFGIPQLLKGTRQVSNEEVRIIQLPDQMTRRLGLVACKTLLVVLPLPIKFS